MPLQLRTRGRPAKEVLVSEVGPVTQADLVVLNEARRSESPALKRISDRHHGLARALASGMPEGEAAVLHGYSLSRVSILKGDPAFQQLLAIYRKQTDVLYRGLHEKLVGVAGSALDELETRLEEAPEDISVGQLIQITQLGADRTGHGPQSTTVNVNIGLADKLRMARERALEASKLPPAEAAE